MESLTVILEKELRPSDVSHLGRIVLPKVSWPLLIHYISDTVLVQPFLNYQSFV